MTCACQQFGRQYLSRFIEEPDGRKGIQCEDCGAIRYYQASTAIAVAKEQADATMPEN